MRIIEKQFLTTAIVTIIVIALVMVSVMDHFLSPQGHIPLVLLLFLTGCLGGVTTHYRRLQSLPFTDEQLKSIVSPYSIIIQSVASPGLGGVFAVIAYLVFGSGLLKGALFPEFVGYDDKYSSNIALKGFFSLVPNLNKDVALMFIWAFVAGFSEKFVPNLLDKLAHDANVHNLHPKIPTDSAPPNSVPHI